MGLDIILLLIYFYPVIFPRVIYNVYGNHSKLIIMMSVFAFPLLYYIIRSEVAKTPFMNISVKSALVSTGVFAIFIVVDIITSRFVAPYSDVLRSFEALVAIMIGEICYIISEKLHR
ncbi:MAG: hypothetical protein MR269_01460 [Clostridiales bacterium]|nr:hypothetical protein [Clostridiales bacterium]